MSRVLRLPYVTTDRPMTHAWLWWPQGTPQSSTTFGGEGCYKVSPSHTHRQDTITDIQCGCQFVWFIGDVVAKVASVSFRGSGRLQIFPSQQEVQIWKKENKGWGEASLFRPPGKWEWSALQKEHCLTSMNSKNNIPSRSSMLQMKNSSLNFRGL